MTKRIFDFLLSFFLILLLIFPLLFLLLLASIDTKSSGFFLQKRVGRYGTIFLILKVRTIRKIDGNISKFGHFLRNHKIDELPQIFNVLIGDMSFVGPRPDEEGYADKLSGKERIILNLRPGITGEASLKYFYEEEILKKRKFPNKYNKEIIYPDKIKMNLNYYYNKSLLGDIMIIIKTILKVIK